MNGLLYLCLVCLLWHFSHLTVGFGQKISLRFKSLSYEPRIYKSAETGVEIVTFEAYSEPQLIDSEIQYILAPIGSDYHYFKVDARRGTVSTNRSIDRQIGQTYNITVIALSIRDETRITNATKHLSIIVSAYNRFAPEFECKTSNLFIPQLSAVGSQIMKVNASDKDSETYNSRIVYTIVSDTQSNLPFAINSSSGHLLITEPLVDRQPLSYDFKIRATDTGSPQRHDISIISIKIEDRVSEPTITSILVKHSKADICWEMPLQEPIDGYLIRYRGENEPKTTTINITSHNNKFECHRYDIQKNINYSLEVAAWNAQGVGSFSQVQYFIEKESLVVSDEICECDSSRGCRPNTNGVCICPKGILGLDCKHRNNCPLICSNDGNCFNSNDGIPQCICKHGFHGQLCQKKVKCKSEKTITSKGVYKWNSTEFGEKVWLPCTYNRAEDNTLSSRLCLLRPNGSAHWSEVNDSYCPEEPQITTTEEIISTTPVLMAKYESIDTVRSLIKTQEDSDSVLRSIDSIINEDIESANDYYNLDNLKIKTIIDNILSVVPVSDGEEWSTHQKTIAAKVVKVSQLNKNNEISFRPEFKFDKLKSHSPKNEAIGPSIHVPAEALTMALHQNNLNEVRVQIVAYNSQKLFKSAESDSKANEMPVIDASVANVTIDNLRKPVTIVLQCIDCNQTVYSSAKCVFWHQLTRKWSTIGIKTELSLKNKSIICHSSHLTAFSVLFDLTPYEPTKDALILSAITSIGCYLSISGLILTLITYLLFRCLNRENSGKILLNLCLSLLLLNVTFIIGSQETVFNSKNSCTLMALSIHYFVFTSLAWMSVEAIHIYQLLIYVFATAETRYMLKRNIIAWGLPLVWVLISVFSKPEAYSQTNNFCMISPKYTDVYYFSYLMPASVLIIVNVSVFVLALRVLFQPRLASSASIKSGSVSMSQVWGALTLMALLGVSWVLGALAIGQMKLWFQYLFCVTNSLQGFLIFLFRCVRYPDARNAWIQFLTSGTLMKYRGQRQRFQGSNGTNRFSASDKKPIETDSSFSMTANCQSDCSDKTFKPFLSSDDCDVVKHYTTYDSIRVSMNHQIDN